MIPQIIHQTWKNDKIPKKWIPLKMKVRSLNPDWKYILWTDLDNDKFVKNEFPDFYPIFSGLSKPIMRADVIRYLIMFKIGGVYLDLDYEVLAPFKFKNHSIILPKNRSRSFGDKEDTLGNCILASEPNEEFWLDVINDLKKNPPHISDYLQIPDATGPGLLTRIYNSKYYENIYAPERPLYHPPTPMSLKEINRLRHSGTSLGMHHPWGSWKERRTKVYFLNKLKEMLRIR